MASVVSMLRVGAFWLLLLISSGAWAQQNVIQAENAKPGDADWPLTVLADNPTVQGYASQTSVNRGETIRFFVSSAAPSYTMTIYRMGWYGGAGARKMLSVTLPGTQQPVPAPDPVTGLIDANWPESYRVTIPQSSDKTDWATGVYLAKLTPSSGSESYIIFVVRDDSATSTYTFQQAVTTYEAYNGWGGKSLYPFNSTNGQARKVSFNRPYKGQGYADWGAGFFLQWEIYFLHFLEREGYDVSYITNLDVHANAGQLQRHKALLIAGHDEYWTYQMRAGVQAAQAQGVHIGFFSSNQTYWQIRLEASAAGDANRTIVGYKEAAQSEDPFALDGDPSNDKFITARYRDLKPIFGVDDPVARPENALVGVMYHGDPFTGDIVVSDPTNWAYSGTGVVAGTRFTGLLGYETDAIFDNGYSPSGLQKIAESPDPWGSAHAATYTTSRGSIVFAAGSMQWSWGLDNYGYRNLENDAVKQTTRNVLARFAIAPPTLAFRTYLSRGGNDANPCSRVAPCRLLPAAIAAVADGGEVWMLDSANYNIGPVNVNKSVTILAIPGVLGSVVALGGNAINIATSDVKVALRNLVIVPFVGGGGTGGIYMTSGASLTVEKCLIANLAGVGIAVSASGASVLVTNTVIRGNGNSGLYVVNGAHATVIRDTISGNAFAAVFAAGTLAGSTTTADIADSTIDANAEGILANSTNASAVVRVSVRNSQVVRNSQYGLVAQSTGGGLTTLSASNNVVSNNGVGLAASSAGARVWASGNTVSDNVTGLFNNAALLESASDNAVRNNGTDTTGAITAIPMQ